MCMDTGHINTSNYRHLCIKEINFITEQVVVQTLRNCNTANLKSKVEIVIRSKFTVELFDVLHSFSTFSVKPGCYDIL